METRNLPKVTQSLMQRQGSKQDGLAPESLLVLIRLSTDNPRVKQQKPRGINSESKATCALGLTVSSEVGQEFLPFLYMHVCMFLVSPVQS